MISTKGRYALRLMIDLAQHNTGDCVPLKEITRRQGISEKYVEAIVAVLVKGRLIAGQWGKGGGYRLTRLPDAYTAWEILEQMEGSLAPVTCLESGAPPCSRAASCTTLPLWRQLHSAIRHCLEGTSLRSLPRESRCPGNWTARKGKRKHERIGYAMGKAGRLCRPAGRQGAAGPSHLRCRGRAS